MEKLKLYGKKEIPGSISVFDIYFDDKRRFVVDLEYPEVEKDLTNLMKERVWLSFLIKSDDLTVSKNVLRKRLPIVFENFIILKGEIIEKKLKFYGKKLSAQEHIATIYTDENKKVIVEAEDSQVKKDLLEEINKEISEHGGIRWPKSRKDDEIYSEEERQEVRERLELLFKKDKKFKKDLEELKNLWRERVKLLIKEEKLLNKKNSEEKEIEELKKEIKEIEEKISKKSGEEEFWWKLIEVRRPITLVYLMFRGGFGPDAPGSPLFLFALRDHLDYSLRRYGGYILNKRLPITNCG